VITRHAFRNGVIPVITLIGLYVPEMIGGAVVLEQVFSWPGLGQLAVSSVTSRDFNVIMGITMVLSIFVLVANLLADVAYAFADPRIRLS
jgi:peptide/nickel transport system permease protein